MPKRHHDQVRSKGALLRLPEEIIDTYGLFATKGARRATLVGRALPSGSVSLMIYAFVNGRKRQQSTGVMLLPESSVEVKNENKEKIRLQRIRVDELNARLEREGAGFTPVRRSKETLTGYIAEMQEKKDKDEARRNKLKGLSRHVTNYEKIAGKSDSRLDEIDEEWVLGFLAYLREAKCVHYKDKSKAPRLRSNTQANILTWLGIVLNAAVKAKLMKYNPIKNIDRDDKPKIESDTRTYLTADEVRRLMETPWPCRCGKDIPTAFLFGVFTGLRFSDICALTPENIERDGDSVYVCFSTKKTHAQQRLRLGVMALKYLPTGKQPGEPLFKLYKNELVNKRLKVWVSAAGITKRVTFHTSRHSAATLLLNSGADITTVAYQLGHKSLKMTEIYAKVVSSTQAAAVANLDAVFLPNEDTLPPGAAPQK